MGIDSFRQQEIYITKFIMRKVFGDEFKPVHTREMVINNSFHNTHHLSESLFYKGGMKVSEKDLLAVPDLITLSDIPSHDPIMINGGWGLDRYSFMIEVTIYDVDSIKRLYLSGYTDRDDLMSILGELNPDILLIFNDCLITQTTFNGPNGMGVTRIINNWAILPDPEEDNRDATLRPSDCFSLIQGDLEVGIYADKEYSNSSIKYTDGRLINRGGKVAAKGVTSLDTHLVKVANDYVSSSVNALDASSMNEAVSQSVWDSREQAAYSSIDLFRLLWEQNQEVITNNIPLGNLLAVAPMKFSNPARDYVIGEKQRRSVDSDIGRLATRDERFSALTTFDSESTSIKSVETKLAQMALQELIALMSVYKINKLGIVATNHDKDYNNEPLVTIGAIDSLVSDDSINQVLHDNFIISFKNKIFNKLTYNDQVAVDFTAYVGFNVEKVELSVNGKTPIVVSLPTFVSSSMSTLVGTQEELRHLSSSYKEVFSALDSNVRALRDSGLNKVASNGMPF